MPKLDAEFEEITEGEELTHKEKLKTKWAALEALVGDPKRTALIAAELVTHFEKRLDAMDGKYGYPPDLQEEAVKTVLRQAELLCAELA